MEKEELVGRLKKITLENCPDTNYEYERELTLLVGKNFNHSEAEDACTILEDYIHQDDEKRKIAYSAFYCLIIFYRHQFNNKALDDLWEKYAKIFANFSDSSFFNDFNNYDNLNDYRSLGHLYLLRFLSNLSIVGDDYINDLEYLDLAGKNIEIDEFSNQNAGYRHNFATLYISIYEKYEGNPKISEEIKNSKWYDAALKEVDLAIILRPNSAVFHCTRGRILSIQGETIEAEINTAISMEDDARKDYSLRMGIYQNYKLLNQMRKQAQIVQKKAKEVKKDIKDTKEKYLTINKEMEKTKDEIKESRVSNIEIIGLFSGVVSFIIGSFNIVTTFSAVEAGLLILTLMGCLTGVLSVFSLLLRGGYNEIKEERSDEEQINKTEGRDKENNKVKSENRKKIPYIIIIICSLFLTIGSIFAMKYFSSNSATNNPSQNTSMDNDNASSDL